MLEPSENRLEDWIEVTDPHADELEPVWVEVINDNEAMFTVLTGNRDPEKAFDYFRVGTIDLTTSEHWLGDDDYYDPDQWYTADSDDESVGYDEDGYGYEIRN